MRDLDEIAEGNALAIRGEAALEVAALMLIERVDVERAAVERAICLRHSPGPCVSLTLQGCRELLGAYHE